jgi:putative phage-type endonuclease
VSQYLYPSGAQVVLAPGAGPDDAAWHATRLLGLGGSDMAAICGLDKWTSALEVWHTKMGHPVPRRDNPVLDEAAENGRDLEPFVASRFTKKTGLKVYPGPGTLQAIDPGWALANLDGAVLDGGEWGVWESKTRSSYALDEWLDEPPTGPWLQVQHYLMVTGWHFGYIACLIGGQRTIVHRVERDDDLIAALRTIGTEFWQRVQDGTPPPVDGSAACTDLLGRLHPEPTEDPVVADAELVEGLLRQRARAIRDMAEPAALRDAAENALRAIAGDAEEVLIRGERAYSWAARRGQISWKSAALDLDPDLDPEPYRGAPAREFRIHLENL